MENGAIVTNTTPVNVGNDGTRGNRLVVDSGAFLFTKNWNVANGGNVNLGKQGVEDGENAIFVGDGASLYTRVFWGYGTGNELSISNGTVSATKFDMTKGTNTFHFAGAAPKLLSLATMITGAECTFSFDVPASGWAEAPMQLTKAGAYTVSADNNLILQVNAREFRKNGGGKVPLAKYNGSGKITFADALISRWNGELASSGCSVAYDSAARTLYLTVVEPELVIMIR